METLVVNLFGAPGAGKSTGAAYVFSKLKLRGINAELVTEFAKDKTWEGSFEPLGNQAYIFGEQSERISRLIGKVNVIVTDSPLLLSLIYNQSEPRDEFDKYVLSVFRKYYNMNFFLNRTKVYHTAGRNQTKEESDAISVDIIGVLDHCDIPYECVDGNEDGYEYILSKIIEYIEGIHNETKVCNMCGKMLDIWDEQEEFSLDKNIGYGSKYDGLNMHLNLCTDCMDKIIEGCRISPLSE